MSFQTRLVKMRFIIKVLKKLLIFISLIMLNHVQAEEPFRRQDIKTDHPFWTKLINPATHSVRVSKQLLDIFRKDHEERGEREENGYLLFADRETGIITSAIGTEYRLLLPESFNFESGFLEYVDLYGNFEDYVAVGWYHSHPGNSDRIDKDLPSPADRINSILKGHMIDLLGTGDDNYEFKVKAFIPLFPLYQVVGVSRVTFIQPDYLKTAKLAKSEIDGTVLSDMAEITIVVVESSAPVLLDDRLPLQEKPFVTRIEEGILRSGDVFQAIQRFVHLVDEEDARAMDQVKYQVMLRFNTDIKFTVELLQGDQVLGTFIMEYNFNLDYIRFYESSYDDHYSLELIESVTNVVIRNLLEIIPMSSDRKFPLISILEREKPLDSTRR